MKIPLNPIAILAANLWRKKSLRKDKTKFPSLLQGKKETSSYSYHEEPITQNTTPESQQALVQNLLRVQELKGQIPTDHHPPSLKYLHTENITKDYLLSSIGTKQKRNLEIVISDEPPTPQPLSPQLKDK